MDEILKIDGLHKSFGDLDVLRGIDMTVARGEVIVLIGASGSGKSTLLRCVNFMEIPTAGQVVFEGAAVGAPSGGRMRYPEAELARLRTRVGMVFQHFNLFPHLTVRGNITLSPRMLKGLSEAQANRLAEAQLAKVGLSEKIDEFPSRL